MSGIEERLTQRQRPNRGWVALGVALLALAGCGGGWSGSQRDEVRDACRSSGGGALECDCTVDAVVNAFPDPGDFRRSSGPTPDLVADLATCGVLGG